MKYYKEKCQITEDNPELQLCENGDFIINSGLVKNYEIIDMHCHLFASLSQLFPPILQKEKWNKDKSLMDMSCFPFSIKLFDLDKIYFTKYPTRLLSPDGIKARIKLFSGALVLNYATEERIIMDMNANHISKSVVQQINPANRNCASTMNDMVARNNRLYTFASIHPYDDNILSKIDDYMNMDIKGWKLNPHIWNVPIDCDKTINLLKELEKTGLPILSCSGTGLPKEMLASSIPTKQTKQEVTTQSLEKFKKVLDSIPDAKFILAHAGCFDFDYMTSILNEFPNTYTDISVQPSKNIKKLIDSVGSNRLLFGTDYPFVSQAFSIASVLRATKNEQDRNNIFSANAKQLLKIC